jgi:hypothetical protein
MRKPAHSPFSHETIMLISRRNRHYFIAVVALFLTCALRAQDAPSSGDPSRSVTAGAINCKQDDPACGIDEAVSRVKKELDSLEARLLAVPVDLSTRYQEFLKTPGTGLTRLLLRGKYEFLPRGGGAYYSFSRRSHDYGSASEIELGTEGFSTGFAGADYGFFLILGSVPIENVPSSEDAPVVGAKVESGAWKQMWSYRPPTDMATLRTEFRSRPRNVQVLEGMTYLLGSIHPRLADILVAFRVERILADGSVVIVWHVLKGFQPPMPTG